MYVLKANAPLQKMFGLAITLNIWKDIENVIFPYQMVLYCINFPKFWKDCLSTTFQ